MGIGFYSLNEVNTDILSEIIAEAILLDESVPYASKRKSL
jgi:hypothetical protein